LMSCPLGRTDPGLRRDDDVLTSVGLRRANQGIECRKIQANEIPISVAPAEAGVQASARMARRFFAWIPAYAGTTVLEPVGLRRDDKVLSVARSKETRSQSPSLRRRPESRHSRAWRATSLTIGVGEQYRCSPPSEPYGRFSRIRLSGQWLSTSRLAFKSVS